MPKLQPPKKLSEEERRQLERRLDKLKIDLTQPPYINLPEHYDREDWEWLNNH